MLQVLSFMAHWKQGDLAPHAFLLFFEQVSVMGVISLSCQMLQYGVYTTRLRAVKDIAHV